MYPRMLFRGSFVRLTLGLSVCILSFLSKPPLSLSVSASLFLTLSRALSHSHTHINWVGLDSSGHSVLFPSLGWKSLCQLCLSIFKRAAAIEIMPHFKSRLVQSPHMHFFFVEGLYVRLHFVLMHFFLFDVFLSASLSCLWLVPFVSSV